MLCSRPGSPPVLDRDRHVGRPVLERYHLRKAISNMRLVLRHSVHQPFRLCCVFWTVFCRWSGGTGFSAASKPRMSSTSRLEAMVAGNAARRNGSWTYDDREEAYWVLLRKWSISRLQSHESKSAGAHHVILLVGVKACVSHRGDMDSPNGARSEKAKSESLNVA